LATKKKTKRKATKKTTKRKAWNKEQKKKIIGVPFSEEDYNSIQVQAEAYDMEMSKWCSYKIRELLNRKVPDMSLVEDK